MPPESQKPEGYSAREVARLVDMPVAQIRSYIRAGLLHPPKGPRGEYRLGFRDVVFLRRARSLMERLPMRRLNRGLRQLKEQIAETRDLSAVRISAEGRSLVTHEHDAAWNLESGQGSFDFDARPAALAQPGGRIAPIHAKPVPPDAAGAGAPGPPPARRSPKASPRLSDADEWYMTGCELEEFDPAAAIKAYMEAIACDFNHTDARINLGRLLHEAGDLAGAEMQCRMALDNFPADATAAFNLGVVLEDLDRPREAIEAYDMAIAADPAHADAHYNAARLHESLGEMQFAIRHLDIYRKLTRGR